MASKFAITIYHLPFAIRYRRVTWSQIASPPPPIKAPMSAPFLPPTAAPTPAPAPAEDPMMIALFFTERRLLTGRSS
jgi:hypothetical protein